MARRAQILLSGTPSTTFQEVAKQFLASRRVAGISPTTLRYYADVIHYLENHGFPEQLDTLDAATVEQYIANIERVQLTPRIKKSQ